MSDSGDSSLDVGDLNYNSCIVRNRSTSSRSNSSLDLGLDDEDSVCNEEEDFINLTPEQFENIDFGLKDSFILLLGIVTNIEKFLNKTSNGLSFLPLNGSRSTWLKNQVDILKTLLLRNSHVFNVELIIDEPGPTQDNVQPSQNLLHSEDTAGDSNSNNLEIIHDNNGGGESCNQQSPNKPRKSQTVTTKNDNSYFDKLDRITQKLSSPKLNTNTRTIASTELSSGPQKTATGSVEKNKNIKSKSFSDIPLGSKQPDLETIASRSFQHETDNSKITATVRNDEVTTDLPRKSQRLTTKNDNFPTNKLDRIAQKLSSVISSFTPKQKTAKRSVEENNENVKSKSFSDIQLGPKQPDSGSIVSRSFQYETGNSEAIATVKPQEATIDPPRRSPRISAKDDRNMKKLSTPKQTTQSRKRTAAGSVSERQKRAKRSVDEKNKNVKSQSFSNIPSDSTATRSFQHDTGNSVGHEEATTDPPRKSQRITTKNDRITQKLSSVMSSSAPKQKTQTRKRAVLGSVSKPQKRVKRSVEEKNRNVNSISFSDIPKQQNLGSIPTRSFQRETGNSKTEATVTHEEVTIDPPTNSQLENSQLSKAMPKRKLYTVDSWLQSVSKGKLLSP